ncbi:hypothetical protein AN161_01380 [Lysinibacillus sp. FJAT-14222]|nr:hypothetical protein AN161_01380 [Lysinibacillus sp. FJAT-14222]
MEAQNEMVQFETWTLVLIESKSGPTTPVIYYNPDSDIFERKLNSKCAYWSEKLQLKWKRIKQRRAVLRGQHSKFHRTIQKMKF